MALRQNPTPIPLAAADRFPAAPLRSQQPKHLRDSRVLVVAGREEARGWTRKIAERLLMAPCNRIGSQFSDPDMNRLLRDLPHRDILVFVANTQEEETIRTFACMFRAANPSLYVVFAVENPTPAHAQFADAVLDLTELEKTGGHPLEAILVRMLCNPPKTLSE